MKTKTLTEQEILRISNDIGEDMCRASAKDLIQVVKYWKKAYDNLNNQFISYRTDFDLTFLTLLNTFPKK